jgi:hypothetical protein
MGHSDKMFEDALNDLREQNDVLREQNRNLKLFLIHLNNEITNFLNNGTEKKDF